MAARFRLVKYCNLPSIVWDRMDIFVQSIEESYDMVENEPNDPCCNE